MVLFRRFLGDVLRAERIRRGMTLREVSAGARVSLGYISEIERGQKEASSELLSSLCSALDLPLSSVLREVSDPDSLITTASADEMDKLIDDGVLTGGMIPKITSCTRAVRNGVAHAHILDGRVPHALLLEMFTRDGIGTMVTA